MRKEYSVYMLKCSDGTYYTGVTNNVERRFSEHAQGLNLGSYTHTRRPVELVYSVAFEDVYEAIHWEKQLKKWSRKKKEAVINNQFELLPSLSKKDFSKCRGVFDTPRMRGATQTDNPLWGGATQTDNSPQGGATQTDNSPQGGATQTDNSPQGGATQTDNDVDE